MSRESGDGGPVRGQFAGAERRHARQNRFGVVVINKIEVRMKKKEEKGRLRGRGLLATREVNKHAATMSCCAGNNPSLGRRRCARSREPLVCKPGTKPHPTNRTHKGLGRPGSETPLSAKGPPNGATIGLSLVSPSVRGCPARAPDVPLRNTNLDFPHTAHDESRSTPTSPSCGFVLGIDLVLGHSFGAGRPQEVSPAVALKDNNKLVKRGVPLFR